MTRVEDNRIYGLENLRDNLCYTHTKTRNTGIFKIPTNVNTCGKIQPKQKQWWKQDAFEDTVKPLYNDPVYSGYPVYYGHLSIPQGWPLYTGLTVNSKVCEVHFQECPGGLAYPYHLIAHTMFYFCVRTPLSGFWCASISCCLDFESKSKCFPAIFYTAVFNINVRHFRDINIFCSSGDVKIGPSKPIKLLIAKLPPIWSLVKAQSYERTLVPQATACFWVSFVVIVI